MSDGTARFVEAVLVCAALLACSGGVASCAPASGGADSEFMSLEEITPGMSGKARSVFSGSRPEEFDVEIVGVIRNWRPGGDLILGRASGEKIERLGIAAGMSGTPVYVDGRLVGAIAFTWPFAKEPMAGITPIRELLELGRRTGADNTGSGAGASRRRSDAAAGMTEIGTPIMVAGLHPEVVGLMRQKLAGYNMVVAQSGEGTTEDLDTLMAGGSLAAQFVTGDAVVSAIGTVTYVNGGRVLGFGHGLFSAGAVDVPMSGARIHAVLPSLASSMKLGSPTGVVGSITGDGEAGVAGDVGRRPDLVPVEVVVNRADQTAETRRFEVIRHRLFTPPLVAWTAASSALGAYGTVGEVTVGMNVSLGLRGEDGQEREVGFRHTFFSLSLASSLADVLAGVVDAVMNNQFEDACLAGVRCDLTLVPEQRTAVIEEVYVSEGEVRPGEEVTVSVRLRPYRGDCVTKRLRLRLPEGVCGERVEFKVCSAPEMAEWKREFTSRRPAPRNLTQLIDWIQTSGRGHVVECAACVDDREVTVRGETLPSPPESMSRVMGNTRRAGESSVSPVAVVSETSWETDYAVAGCRTVSVRLGQPKSRR
ncbi:MAG: hypothetical protein JW952_00995 [Candidatus Eisenbacteria bacterium]|nr:hypothetical protein [Candidatus Eisenbacteria bacterium]